jgi:hypothetical protein
MREWRMAYTDKQRAWIVDEHNNDVVKKSFEWWTVHEVVEAHNREVEAVKAPLHSGVRVMQTKIRAKMGTARPARPKDEG